MGIDVYARWDGQTEAERDAQYTGFSVQHGHVGYLREAYHGGPYATKVLFPEAFADDNMTQTIEIDDDRLVQRLPDAIEAAVEREKTIYELTEGDARSSPMIQSLRDFVDLIEAKRKAGKHPAVYVSY